MYTFYWKNTVVMSTNLTNIIFDLQFSVSEIKLTKFKPRAKFNYPNSYISLTG